MRQNKKKKRRTAKQSKQEFTAKTRVYDLLKKEFHDELKQLSEDIKKFVCDGSTIDWKHLRYFAYDEKKIKKAKFILIIAEFLIRIGKDNGLKSGNLSVFIRYIASNEHSNFGLKPSSLNTLIHRMFAYLEGKENET
jgi:hypothetical protein